MAILKRLRLWYIHLTILFGGAVFHLIWGDPVFTVGAVFGVALIFSALIDIGK